MRLLTSLVLVLALPLIAASRTDSTQTSFKRFGFSIQGGPPVRILSTEFIDEDSPGLVPIGNLKRYAYSVGGEVHYSFSPNLSAFVRFATVRRDFLASDSIYTVIGDNNDGFVHSYSATAEYTYTDYTVRNMLFGLGASYKVPIGKLKIQAGAELAYVRYLQINYNTGSRYHTIVKNDSLNNSHDYSSQRLNKYYSNETFPNVNSLGILLHSGIEYLFCPNFGVEASMIFGSFYSWANKTEYVHVDGNTSDFSDSNNVQTHSGSEIKTVSIYSRKQFDFSPPTGLLGLNFYF